MKNVLSPRSPYESLSLSSDLSLRDRKQLKWEKEKAENTEWFPFGKPGSGAPLRPKYLNCSSKSTPSITPESGRNNENYVDHHNPVGSGNRNQPHVSYDNENLTVHPPTHANTSGRNFITPPQWHNNGALPVPFDATVYSPAFLAYLDYLYRNGGYGRSQPSVQLGGGDMTNHPIRHNSQPNYPNAYVAYPQMTVSLPSSLSAPHPYVLSYQEFLALQNGHLFKNAYPTQNLQTPSPPRHFGPNSLPLQSSGGTQQQNRRVNPTSTYSSSPVHGERSHIHVQPINLHSTAFLSPEHHVFPGSRNVSTNSSDPYNVLPNLQNEPTDNRQTQNYNNMDYYLSSEYDIHRRRNVITEPKDVLDVEEKLYRSHETKLAIDEQIVEKRRQKLLENAKELMETERLMQEHARLDSKEKRENQQELNKWKELEVNAYQLEKQRRMKYVEELWANAKAEAEASKRNRLLLHVMQVAANNSNKADSNDSPFSMRGHSPVDSSRALNDASSAKSPKLIYSSSYEMPTNRSQMKEVELKRPSSAQSNFAIHRSTSPPLRRFEANLRSPDDDRPIRPLMKDPLEIWENSILVKKPSVVCASYRSTGDDFRSRLSNNIDAPIDNQQAEVVSKFIEKSPPRRQSRFIGDKSQNVDLKPVREERNSRSLSKRCDDVGNKSGGSLLKPSRSKLSDARDISASTEKNKRVPCENICQNSMDTSNEDEHSRHPSLTNVTARRGQKLMSRPKEINMSTIASSPNDVFNESGDKSVNTSFRLNRDKPSRPSLSASKNLSTFPPISNDYSNVHFVDEATDSDDNGDQSLAKENILNRLSQLHLDTQRLTFLRQKRSNQPKVIFLKNQNSAADQESPSEISTIEILEQQISNMREKLKQSQQVVSDSLLVHNTSSKSFN